MYVFAVRMPYTGGTSMARTIRDAKLDTRTARLKLAQRREPYWRPLSAGLAVGYRRGSTGGTWIARHYSRATGRRYLAIGPADDTLDAGALSFDAAQAKAREWLGSVPTEPDAGPLTVARACDDYLAFLRHDGRSDAAIRDAAYRIEAFIRPTLGRREVHSLKSDEYRRWRDQIANTPARLRTKDGSKQKHRAGAGASRARRATVNRIWTTFRAALNHAFAEGRVASDTAWRKVKPFREVESARIRYLTVAEAKRLINACSPDFRPLVQAGLQTGCRLSELARLEVRDFNVDAGTLSIRQSKSGKPRHVVLTAEGHELFIQLTAGRGGDELILGRWAKAQQVRPMADAVQRAVIKPRITFHGLRHTWASLAVMSGMPLMVVARNLGHADTRMVERHYGHLAPSFIADAIRKHAPRFGAKASNVTAIGR
jgi:integrase